MNKIVHKSKKTQTFSEVNNATDVLMVHRAMFVETGAFAVNEAFFFIGFVGFVDNDVAVAGDHQAVDLVHQDGYADGLVAQSVAVFAVGVYDQDFVFFLDVSVAIVVFSASDNLLALVVFKDTGSFLGFLDKFKDFGCY